MTEETSFDECDYDVPLKYVYRDFLSPFTLCGLADYVGQGVCTSQSLLSLPAYVTIFVFCDDSYVNFSGCSMMTVTIVCPLIKGTVFFKLQGRE